MGIWEVVTSLFGGGLVGLLGSVITNVMQWQTKKLELQAQSQKMAHELAMRRVDGELMAQEWAARTKVAEVEAGAKVEVADAEAFGKSFETEYRFSEGITATPAQNWLLILLDAARAVVRPALTVYLCAITTWLYMDAHKLLRADDFSQTQAEALVLKIVHTILFLTTTCVLWWFGTRTRQQPPKI